MNAIQLISKRIVEAARRAAPVRTRPGRLQPGRRAVPAAPHRPAQPG